MQVYRGVVRGNVVVLPDDVQLEDGAPVEVRVLHGLMNGLTEEEAERAFERWLLAAGILLSIPPPPSSLKDEDFDFEPFEVEGEPLSEQIIRERRG